MTDLEKQLYEALKFLVETVEGMDGAVHFTRDDRRNLRDARKAIEQYEKKTNE